MKSNKKITLIFGLIALVVVFIWLMDGSSSGDARSTYTSSNWDVMYDINSKDPQGLYVFNTMLDKHIKKPHRVSVLNKWSHYDSLVKKPGKSTYLFVGHEFQLLKEEMDTILTDVSNGSELVLSFYNLSQNIYDTLFDELSFNYDYSEDITVYAGKNKFKLYNIYQMDTVAREWEAFEEIYPADSNYTVLSSFMEMANYIKIKHGKGYIYLHSNPQLFFNYQLLQKDGYRQATYFIHHIPKDQNVLWMELGRLNGAYGSSPEPEPESGGKVDDSYFKLLFKSPALLMALLMVIFSFTLFLLFRAKRMRPVVPYMEPKKNMTLSFAETITSIYFSKQSPKGLLSVQRKNFYNTVQKHFFVDLSRREEDKEIKILSEKSNVPFDELKDFIDALENKRANEVDNKYISEVAKRQRDFYHRTGIISKNIQQRLEKYERKFNRSLWLPSILILGGIFIILYGFYLLVGAKGIGIALWPIGFASVSMGILRLRKPLVIVTKEHLIICPVVGKNRKYLLDELSSVENSTTMVHFYFTENRKIKINYWEMSSFDKKQFEYFVSNLHKLEL